MSNPAPPEEALLCHLEDPDRFQTTSLVLSSAALPHRVVVGGGGRSFSIFVRRNLLAEAQYQLAAWEEESRHWPPPERADLTEGFAPFFKMMPLVIVLGLLFLFRHSGDWSQGSPWFTAGEADAVKILHGQWFRTLTALTLHADSLHLLGNVVSALLFLPFLFAVTGSGVGSLALVLTGGIANFCNALAHSDGHLSVGFSTAIFCALGMVCTFGVSLPRFPGEPLRRRLLRLLLPLGGGLAFVAMLGSGGPATDLGAHLFGLFTGVICGNTARLPGFDRLRRSLPVQLAAGGAAAALMWLAWEIALTTL